MDAGFCAGIDTKLIPATDAFLDSIDRGGCHENIYSPDLERSLLALHTSWLDSVANHHNQLDSDIRKWHTVDLRVKSLVFIASRRSILR